MSTTLNIEWERGETEEWTLAVTNADGTPSNLSTALAVEFEVKKFRGAADPALLHLAVGSGLTLRTQVGADVGLVDLVASSTQTFALAGEYEYDVWVTRADSARKLVMQGTLTVDEVVNFL